MNNLAMHIMDIVQNAIRAGGRFIVIKVDEQPQSNYLSITIEDDGSGIPEDIVQNITDPYVTTRNTRNVGLGLSLFKQSAEQSDGYINIDTKTNVGTIIKAVFMYDHIDRPPIGNIAETIVVLVTTNTAIDFLYEHNYNDKNYTFDSREIKEILQDTPFSAPGIYTFLKEMVAENVRVIQAEGAK